MYDYKIALTSLVPLSYISDSACKDGLYCFHRDPYESVPGCGGGSKSSSSKLQKNLWLATARLSHLIPI